MPEENRTNWILIRHGVQQDAYVASAAAMRLRSPRPPRTLAGLIGCDLRGDWLQTASKDLPCPSCSRILPDSTMLPRSWHLYRATYQLPVPVRHRRPGQPGRQALTHLCLRDLQLFRSTAKQRNQSRLFETPASSHPPMPDAHCLNCTRCRVLRRARCSARAQGAATWPARRVTRSMSSQYQLIGETTYLLSSDRVLVDAPALAEAVGQLKDRQDQFSFGCTALLEAGLESQALNIGGILRGGRKVEHCLLRDRFAAPSVPSEVKVSVAPAMCQHKTGAESMRDMCCVVRLWHGDHARRKPSRVVQQQITHLNARP